MITRLSTAPALEPVTLTEAKLHLRLRTTPWEALNYTTEDNLLNDLIETARQVVEDYTHRALVNQTWVGYLDSFPACVRLPRPPFQSVTSITVEGTAFTDFYESAEGILTPTDTWPLLSSDPGADPIVITWVAGYGATADDVPKPLRQAILLLISHLYSNREALLIGVNAQELPMGVQYLLNPHRWLDLA